MKPTKRYHVRTVVEYRYGGEHYSTLEAPTLEKLHEAVNAFRRSVARCDIWRHAAKVSFGDIVYETTTRKIPVRYPSKNVRRKTGRRIRGSV